MLNLINKQSVKTAGVLNPSLRFAQTWTIQCIELIKPGQERAFADNH